MDFVALALFCRAMDFEDSNKQLKTGCILLCLPSQFDLISLRNKVSFYIYWDINTGWSLDQIRALWRI
jgi:hypothetical protein